MYIYIENNIYLDKEKINLIIDYEHFCISDINKKFLEKRKKYIIDVSDFNENRRKRTIIFTHKYIYITSYDNRTLKSRLNEYEKLVNSIVF